MLYGGGVTPCFTVDEKNHDFSVIAPFLMSGNTFKQCDSAVLKIMFIDELENSILFYIYYLRDVECTLYC